MKNILVTGANGFVGRHLINELLDGQINVTAIGGHQVASNDFPETVSYRSIDLTDRSSVDNINFVGIEAVIHLAGLAAIAPSFDDPMGYLNTNVSMESNLFEAALKQSVTPKFLIISSGSLYDSKSPLPLTESSGVLPSSPYAVSKMAQEQMASYYEQRGFECIIARPFNHIGPGQGPGFIVPDLIKQVVDFEKGTTDRVLVGNLDSKRDYTDVRDIARAYRLLLDKGVSGEIYNVCSGKSVSGNEILELIIQNSGINPPVIEDSSRMRPSDTPLIYGNHQKLTENTGWQPEIDIDSTIKDALTDWRSHY